MMDITGQAKTQLEMSRSVYDLNASSKLKEAALSGDPEAIEEAAKQFEAVFVKMLLKSMRQAQEALADKDSPFNSDQVKYYRDMHDQQMAVDLSTSGNIGLAEVIVQQMSINNGTMPASAIRNDGNLSSINRQQVIARQRSEQALFGDMSTNKRAGFDSPEAFVESLYPYAQAAAEKLNIDPKALLAQAAVETGWGKYIIHQQDGASSHNLFGIKADSRWQGDKAVVDTLEYVNDVPEKQQAAFRSYQDFNKSLDDYVNFIQSNPRYENATNNTQSVDQYFKELQQAGYATDPAYAEKVMSVYNGELLNGLLP
jgi:flagellar protein FlgJ